MPSLTTKFEREGVTLRQLLNLDILPGVPKTWPDDTYDYFWIVDFAENSNVPSKFTMMKQEFGTSFPKVPLERLGHARRARRLKRLQDQGRGLTARAFAGSAQSRSPIYGTG